MSASPRIADISPSAHQVRYVPILLQKLNGFPAYCQISLFNEELLPILAMIFGGVTALWATI
jgi:hypothetical protein